MGPPRQRDLGGAVRVARGERDRLHRADDRATRKRNSPLPEAITADEVGATAAFLCSPLASGITGTTVYVDKGYHAMGIGAPLA